MNNFLQLAAEKMDSKNSAARKFFGPSYFVTTFVLTYNEKKASLFFDRVWKYGNSGQDAIKGAVTLMVFVG